MSFGNLKNCPRCGKIFVQGPKNVCPTCVKEVDEEYHRCADFLRENKLVNIYQLSEETEVTVKQITEFIREGRISIADFPNVGYPCESCGTPISEGRVCKACRDRLQTGFKKALEENNPKQKEGPSGLGYYELGKDNK